MITKRILALILTLCMAFSLTLPGVAYASVITGHYEATVNLGNTTANYDVTYYGEGEGITVGADPVTSGNVTIGLEGNQIVDDYGAICLPVNAQIALNIGGYYNEGGDVGGEEVPVESFDGITINAIETMPGGVGPQIPVTFVKDNGTVYIYTNFVGDATINASWGYAFDGGFSTPSLHLKVRMPDSIVTFKANGGTLGQNQADSVTVGYGSTIAQPTVSRPGYTLTGWFASYYVDGTEVVDTNYFDFSTPITQNMTLTAQWSATQATSISLDQDTLNLHPGETATLIATVEPEDAVVDTWATTNSAVATVENGVVTAVASGSAYITANAGNHSATCTVAVTAAAEPDPVASVEGTPYTTLDGAFEAASEAGTATILLLADVNDFSGYEIESGKSITLDLNGHSVTTAETIAGHHAYAFSNYGTFTLEDNNPGESNGVFARGISNKVGGDMIINSGMFVAVDTNGGAAIWNEGTLTINGGTMKTTYVGSASDSSGPGCLNNSGTAYIHGGTFTSVNNRCYAIISSGTMTVDETNGAVTVNGTHGGISCDYGSLTINGGAFTCTNYYAVWITNDGNATEVNINGGSFTGGLYGLYATVDDGNQDEGDVTVTITGGAFKGGTAPALAVKKGSSTHSWGMTISGGIFSTAPDADYVTAPLEVVNNTDQETANEYPFTIGEHVHNYVYGAPVWLWKVVNGTWSASSSSTGVCSCGQKTTEILPATVTKTETESEITYTATDSKGNTDDRTYQKTFTVTYADDSSQVSGTYLYGAACKLTTSGDKLYDWYVQQGSDEAILRAKATATFYFAVTGNVTVTKTENTDSTPKKDSAVVVEASSPAAGQYRYKFVWSIPEGSQVQSAMIYRCMDTYSPLIDDANTLLAQTNLRSFNTNLYVRNGEFTLSGKNLTSKTTQTIMFRLVYTLDGETHTLDTPLKHIDIS